MKISIDENVCIGCGLCASVCSECFQMEGNVAKVVKSECLCNSEELKEIVENCPVEAIKIKK